MIPWSIMVAGIPWYLQKFASKSSFKYKSNWKLFLMFAGPYLLIVVIRQLCLYFRLNVILAQNIKMSKEVHFKMTFNTIHASVNKYFDRIPVGRLLNRFLKDVQILDEMFPFSFIMVYEMT